MKLEINDDHTIGDLKQEFHKRFPLLKLEFFRNEGAEKTVVDAKHRLSDDSLKLALIRKNHNAGLLTIEASSRVADIETIFSRSYGLAVQILRKSGNLWLVTSGTDNLTLEAQNNLAKEMDRTPESEEPADYHEQD